MPDTIPKIRPVDLPKPKPRRSFTARQVAAVFIKYEGRCAKCSEKVALDGYEIDHITRLDALGKHELENWQLLCIGCHKPKTKVDNAEAKKGARIRGEKGQRARRERNGAQITSRGFQKRPDGAKHQWPKRKLGQ
jgi:5-methylcytosine-specific restriction endonuclease McrA